MEKKYTREINNSLINCIYGEEKEITERESGRARERRVLMMIVCYKVVSPHYHSIHLCQTTMILSVMVEADF